MIYDCTWNKQNVLSLNVSVHGQVGRTGALIKPLKPTATSRSASCSMCLGRTPWSPCSGRVLSLGAGGGGHCRVVLILLPLSAVWNKRSEQTDPLGIAHPRTRVCPVLSPFISTSSLGRRGSSIALWLFARPFHPCLL